MPTFRFNKLVRDGMPVLYEQLGQQISFRRLVGAELLRAYRNKFIEEASELPEDGDRQKTIEELADLEQLKKDSQALLGVTDEEIETIRLKKLHEKGGFSEGIFVDTISLEDEEWVNYYRSEPEKYPEAKE